MQDSKRHRFKEQTFGLWEKARVGWYERITLKHVFTICKIDDQCQFNAWIRALKAGALGQPQRDGVGEGGGWEIQNGGTYVQPWLIHVNVWQKPPQCCKVVSLQLKKKKKKTGSSSWKWWAKGAWCWYLAWFQDSLSQGSPALGPTSDTKNVSFNYTIAIYFTSKVGLFGKSQRNCSFWNASYGEPWANLDNKEGNLLL